MLARANPVFVSGSGNKQFPDLAAPQTNLVSPPIDFHEVPHAVPQKRALGVTVNR